MIGIMSDSHDNLHSIKLAVQLFQNAGCSLVIHAGDFVAPFAARELKNLCCPVKAVFGNCDGEKEGLKKVIQPFGEIKNAPLSFSFQSLNFLVVHILETPSSFPPSSGSSVIIFGHTHKPELRQKGDTLFINPGETGGWLSSKNTVALLDTKTRIAEIITL
jgi:putative phosphoesterase